MRRLNRELALWYLVDFICHYCLSIRAGIGQGEREREIEMSKRSYTPHRVDGNHAEVTQALRDIGASVLDIHDIGGGAPDLLIGYRGQNILLEVKDGRLPPSHRKLTLDEYKFCDNWRGGSIYIIYSPVDAVTLVNKMTMEDDGIPF